MQKKTKIRTPLVQCDFKIGTMDFEVGGKGKGEKQIKTAEKGYVVKDDRFKSSSIQQFTSSPIQQFIN